MNPHQIKTWESVESWLRSKGFVPTSNTIDGGRYWRSKSGRHMIVPDHVDGFYPDFFLADLIKRVEQIVP